MARANLNCHSTIIKMLFVTLLLRGLVRPLRQSQVCRLLERVSSCPCVNVGFRLFIITCTWRSLCIGRMQYETNNKSAIAYRTYFLIGPFRNRKKLEKNSIRIQKYSGTTVAVLASTIELCLSIPRSWR